MSNAKQQTYGAEDIEILEGLEPVRKRPGMYIAGTDTPAGLHQLVFEILDNSVDEAMNGHADKISVILHKDGQSVSVSDNGRGIPVDKHPKFNKPALEIILTTLHAGGKFSDKNYKTAGGLHGVGSSVVNALSSELVARIKRDGSEYQQTFSRGKPTSSLKVVAKNVRGTGTSIFFRPDLEIFPKLDFSADLIRQTLQTKAYLNPGLALEFIDERAGSKQEFCYKEGLLAFLKQIQEERKVKLVTGENFLIEQDNQIQISLAFCWTQGTSEAYYSFANGIRTEDGGSHENGFKSGIARALRNYLNVHDVQVKGLKIGAEDIREGLLAIVSVKLPGDTFQAQYQGQTKSKLNNPEVAPLVESALRSFEQMLNERPSVAEEIVGRIVLAAKARAASREAAQNVRRKIGISHRLTLPGKLADCSLIKPHLSELFIVEGDSAGGSTKQARDRKTQAVLPLRGKVLNTISSANKKISDNKELSNIVAALGCGMGEHLDLSKLRYGKVVILTDADADGMHIATLLMAFFFQHMRKLIEGGHLFLGKPPLYGVFSKSAKYWAYSDSELQETIAKHKLSSPRIVRYKGLGEMNPETLWETTLDPERRTLLRISIQDEKLLEEGLEALMGSDSSQRYEMIKAWAQKVDLDI